MRIRHLLTTAAVGGALLMAGCGDDEDSGSSSSGGAAAPSGDVVKIPIKNIKFVPEEQRVKVGQTVEWTNEDSVPHNVIDNGDAFSSETLDKGAKFTWKADKPGTYNYVCSIHSGQTGKLIVE